jgi:hypothetical protein
MRALLEETRHARSLEFEEKLALHPVDPPLGKILFRVLAANKEGVMVRASVIGRSASDIEMHDDGREGDQRPQDSVWSAYFDARAGHKINYSYWERKDGTFVKEFKDSSFSGLVRNETVPASRIVDIDVFGDYYLKSDGSHPDPEGQRLIAQRLYDHIASRDDVRAFLAGAARAAS